MTVISYDIATLVPRGLYASKAREVLGAARRMIAEMPDPLPSRLEIDSAVRALSASYEIAAADLFSMIRVALAWPLATVDLFETIRFLGNREVLARLDVALLALTDLA